MFRRNVQGVEVVVLGFDLGPLHDAVSHSREDVDDLVLDDRQRMQRAGAGPSAGERHVDGVCPQQRVLTLGLQKGPALRDRRPQPVPDLVRPLPDAAPFNRAHRPQRALHLLEPRPAAEGRCLGRLKRGEVRGPGYLGQAPALFLVKDRSCGIGVHVPALGRSISAAGRSLIVGEAPTPPLPDQRFRPRAAAKAPSSKRSSSGARRPAGTRSPRANARSASANPGFTGRTGPCR